MNLKQWGMQAPAVGGGDDQPGGNRSAAGSSSASSGDGVTEAYNATSFNGGAEGEEVRAAYFLRC